MKGGTMKQLRVTRPDGNVLYEMVLQEHHEPICLGKLYVEGGRIVLHCTVDEVTDTGSVVEPEASWIGDMAFSTEKDSFGTISLSKENFRLIIDKLKDVEDKGPVGQGWKSDELKELSAYLERVVDEAL